MAEGNGELRRIFAAVATAAILGAWTFAATRASSQDIEVVRAEIEEVEKEAKERHVELARKVDSIAQKIQLEAVAAAAFRAEVRAALEIRDGRE
jgi:hypothetical protein